MMATEKSFDKRCIGDGRSSQAAASSGASTEKAVLARILQAQHQPKHETHLEDIYSIYDDDDDSQTSSHSRRAKSMGCGPSSSAEQAVLARIRQAQREIKQETHLDDLYSVYDDDSSDSDDNQRAAQPKPGAALGPPAGSAERAVLARILQAQQEQKQETNLDD